MARSGSLSPRQGLDLDEGDKQFDKRLKWGVHKDSTAESGDEQISVKEHIDRTKEGQNGVYHITIKTIAAMSSSPFIETLKKKA
jgi:molecular chaperone HtpG